MVHVEAGGRLGGTCPRRHLSQGPPVLIPLSPAFSALGSLDDITPTSLVLSRAGFPLLVSVLSHPAFCTILRSHASTGLLITFKRNAREQNPVVLVRVSYVRVARRSLQVPGCASCVSHIHTSRIKYRAHQTSVAIRCIESPPWTRPR